MNLPKKVCTFAEQKSHIMADLKIDIERMIMQARYAMQLEAEASSVKGGEMSDMEREQYQKQIKDLLQAVETLLKSNNAMGERVAQLEKIAEDYEDLKAENAKLKGLKNPLNPNLLLTVARMRMRENTLRMVARTMFLQLMMTRKRKKRMPLLENLRSRNLAI